MRAVVIVDGGIRVEERPDPVPGAGELLVRVEAAGLNGADLMQTAGVYPPPAGLPEDMPGLEMAGAVAAVGPGVRRFVVGDHVMAVLAGAAQAELAVVHERLAMPVPESMPPEAAGGFPEVFTTAHDAVFTQCGLGPGEALLVTGAAGGVGTAAVQLGVAAGARVVASVRSEALRQAVAAFGATAVGPGEEAEHGAYDVVLELVGAPNLPSDLQNLAPRGRIVVIGVGAGARAEIDLRQLMNRRGRIHASTLRSRSLEDKADAARRVEHHVLPLVAAGRVQVPVDATFPMSEAPAAYARFAEGGKLGKVVLLA